MISRGVLQASGKRPSDVSSVEPPPTIMADEKPVLPSAEETKAEPPESKDSKSTKTVKEDRQSVVEELEQLCTACIDAFNDHDLEYSRTAERREFHSRISPNFQARVEHYPEKALSWAEMRHLWHAFTEAEPNARLRIANINTDVNANGTAIVWIEVDATGQHDVRFNRFLEMKWRVRQGVWMYYSLTTISGDPGHSGFV